MKTLFTFLLAIFVAFAASAQEQVEIIKEGFNGSVSSNFSVSLSGNSWSYSTTTPKEGTHSLETDNGNSTRTFNVAVNGVPYDKIEVSWWERKSGDVLSRTLLYRVGNEIEFRNAKPGLSTVVSTEWQLVTVVLPSDANYQNVQLQWNINRTAGPSNKSQYAVDLVTIKGSKTPTIFLSENILFFDAEAGQVSLPRAYNVSGIYLTDNVTVVAPEHFMVSRDNQNFYSSVVVYHTFGSISSTPIYVKYSRPAKPGDVKPIDYSYVFHDGNINHYSGSIIEPLAVRGQAPVPGQPFPVELASFQGEELDGAAKLAWTTASEKNNDKFVVERSQDGKSFSQVGEVKGSGNSATKRNYSYTDNAPAAGVNYYRLRQIDFDGTVTFSNVMALEVAGGSLGATVYPTVASAKAVTISLQNVKGNASISVVDATGRPVASFTNTTAREIELPVHNLKSGMYFVRVTDGQSQQVQRFIKK